jgi:sorting nexin-1/2
MIDPKIYFGRVRPFLDMASFDDLLAPSRSILEDNPFSNPFSDQSSSDPWASPFSQPNDDVYTGFGGTLEPEHSSAQEENGHEHIAHAEEDFSSQEQESKDPLDSAAANAADDEDEKEDSTPLAHKRAPSLASPAAAPGFKESVEPSEFSEIATIRPASPEEAAPAPNLGEGHLTKLEPEPAQPAVPSTPSPTSPTPIHRTSQSLSKSAILPESSSSPWSPLNSAPHGSSLSNSLAGMTVGGDHGGWQQDGGWGSDQQTHTRYPTDEDSEDDKPIGQLVRDASKPNSPVCHHNRYHVAP